MDIKITDVRQQKGDAAFLLDDGKTSILYDTGFGFTGYAVADNVKAYLGERRLDYIFLTHSHYDHALGSAYILRRYPDAKVVAGSCAVPGVFTPMVHEGMHLIDGGLRNNVPVDVVKKMGANVVFAIDVNHLRGTGTGSLSTLSVLTSTIGIMMQSKIDKTLEMADLIFEPSLETFSPLKLDDIDEMIQIGYDTVMANKDKITKMLKLNPKKIGKFFTKDDE